MISKVALRKIPALRLFLQRNFHICAIAFNDCSKNSKIDDPVQKMFLKKIREYKEKSKKGGMVDPTPELVNELKSEIERINKKYGGDGKTDLTKFPDLKFPDIKIDPISSETEEKKK